VGVDTILAVLKFSTSPRIFGVKHTTKVRADTTEIRGIMSLIKKTGKNLILSTLVTSPVGFDDPVWWRKIKCINAKATKTNGRRKCSE